MIILPELKPYIERYNALSTEPLEIICELMPDALRAGYDPLALDDLLAYVVVHEATQGRIAQMNYNDGPLLLPIPCKCLWLSPDNLPLWATTYFWPVGETRRESVFRHKRQFDGRWTLTPKGRFNISPSDGRWMERRVPLPAEQTQTLRATCIGNAEEIARLLGNIAQVGKGRGMGLGQVYQWRVEPIETFALIGGGRLLRAIPKEANVLPRHPTAAPTLIGWTPPQWKRGLFSPGWAAGTSVEAWMAGVECDTDATEALSLGRHDG